MSVIHRTTLRPAKLELLADWLPTRPWYHGGPHGPRLSKAGGFRLDDPKGEVGIELMVVRDDSGDAPAVYLVPLTYRGAPLDGADAALLGTAEHGVLGRRWIYDACHDPVAVAELAALVEGRVQPQAQSVSDTPDHEVTRALAGEGPVPAEFPTVVDTEEHTELTAPDGTVLRVLRTPHPAPDGVPQAEPGAAGHVAGAWEAADGTRVQGLMVLLLTPPPAP
ncbi:1,4-alpha-glucan branching protein [Streptomyces sp. DH-12]|uniref:maltokinase N-terminal cap-like domain-containing protein n=1 Tax=unclassified Streptomyces TaxID=2593676 RepID=UPI000CCE9E3C|nr:1,4-alpha-glucan branching protein [Streptomyces sp. DH-12]PNV32680.1 1,4-alpha-glucan branching protein [Streptomyces sp. DH-12]